ncbi:hypothetical protein ACFFTN_01420 [Aminobacter aganoensis]|uniref:Uncharacterized protein n=1 Tax=Aminobacter aganoensis TaxID=83264 RepID=A0A7X0F5F6_9HYPH|nr:hypothetical protein [Aminobacter aganoensis]MBB6353481.1 hypothetical protein [Aminobacter aganoensis]
MAKGICGPSSADMKEWEAEDDLRTLINAEKVKADPARLKAAMKKQAEMKKAIDAVGSEAKK